MKHVGWTCPRVSRVGKANGTLKGDKYKNTFRYNYKVISEEAEVGAHWCLLRGANAGFTRRLLPWQLKITLQSLVNFCSSWKETECPATGPAPRALCGSPPLCSLLLFLPAYILLISLPLDFSASGYVHS